MYYKTQLSIIYLLVQQEAPTYEKTILSTSLRNRYCQT